MFCANCGGTNQNDAKFCNKCGGSLNEDQPEVKPPDTKGLKDEMLYQKVDFLQALFDFSFTDFITSKIIKFLYGLSILFAGLTALVFVIVAFKISIGVGILTLLIFAPLAFLLTVIYTRVLLEIIIVIFRIAENISDISKKLERTPE